MCFILGSEVILYLEQFKRKLFFLTVILFLFLIINGTLFVLLIKQQILSNKDAGSETNEKLVTEDVSSDCNETVRFMSRSNWMAESPANDLVLLDNITRVIIGHTATEGCATQVPACM